MVFENSSLRGKSLDMKPFFFFSAGTVSLYMVLSMYLSFDSDHNICGGASVLHSSHTHSENLWTLHASGMQAGQKPVDTSQENPNW